MDKNSITLFRAIENLLSASLKKLSYDKIGTVIRTDGSACVVKIDGADFTIKNGIGVTFKNGDRCLVHFINGSQKNKVIIAKL